jgi:molybdenum-dependent DNA-binding transcriptional regulator ModE
MPKTAYLANHFSSGELKEKYFKSKDSVEARRWHLLWKVSQGWTIKNSALAVGCSYPYAQKIINRYNQNGKEGVRNRKNQTSNHVRGKKRLLSQPQLEKPTRAIANQPADEEI